MLTEEQIQWLVPVFNTAYDILSKIPDIEPASKRGHRINAIGLMLLILILAILSSFLIKIKAYSKLYTSINKINSISPKQWKKFGVK